MKKIMILLAAVFMIGAQAVTAQGNGSAANPWHCGVNGDNVTAALIGGTLTISGTGDMADYPRASSSPLLAPPWYNSSVSITRVVIEDGVTSIGQSTFYSCLNVTSVTIGNSVTTDIGYQMFHSCTKLTSIEIASDNPHFSSENDVVFNKDKTTLMQYPLGKQGAYIIPNSVTSIANWAFAYCAGLTSVTYGNSVNSVGSSVFYLCTKLASIEAASGNPNFSSQDGVLFNKNKTELITYPQGKQGASYTIPSGVTSIPSYAFSDASELTSITVPNSLTIESYTFSNFDKLASIEAASDNPNFSSQDGVLFNKNKTTLILYPRAKQGASYTIPNGVTSIGDRAFYYSGLTSITIPSGVTFIGDRAFYSSGFTSITIPSSVTNIAYGAFQYCRALTSIVNLNPNPQTFAFSHYTFENIFDRTTTTLYVPQSSIAAYRAAHIWKEFTNIKSTAEFTINVTFNSLGGSAVTPQSVGLGVKAAKPSAAPTRTGYIFSGWYKNAELTEAWDFDTDLVWSDMTLYAGWSWDCGEITGTVGAMLSGNTLTISGNGAVKDYSGNTGSVPWYASRASITNVVIGEGVTSIGGGVFSELFNLASVTVSQDNKNYSSDNGVLFNKNKTTLLKYPRSKQGAYVIPGGVTAIEAMAFRDCANLTSVTIPSSVTTIGNGAFFYCAGLKSVVIPNSVTSIGEGAFQNCDDLTTVTIGDGVTTIGDFTFSHCAKLTSVKIGGEVATIGNYAFENCTSLPSVTIPNSVTAIGDYAFQYCGKLTSVIIPNAVVSIGERAFYWCQALSSVTIGRGVTDIGSEAFWSISMVDGAIISLNTEPPKKTEGSGSYGIFSSTLLSNYCLFVPQGSESAYGSADEWKGFDCVKSTSEYRTVTYDINGGTGETPTAHGFSVGNEVKLAGGTGFSRAGFVFECWNTSANGSGTNYAAGDFFEPSDDITLYAKWSAVVTYDLNGGTGETPPPQVVGSAITLADASGFSRSGFSFAGWNTSANGLGTNYAAGSSFTPATGITLYVRWTAAVTYSINGGTGNAPSAQTFNAGNSVTLAGASGFSRSGFSFTGWDTETDGSGTNYAAGSSFTPAGNITLYAKWEITVYTVTWNAGGGAPVPAQTSVNHGGGITAPANMTRAGYDFGGWYANSGLTTAAVFPITNVTDNITLYAKWTASVSVLSPNRVIPDNKPATVISDIQPLTIMSGEFTAGPNPVAKSSGRVDFFWQGKDIENAKLSIYNASGNLVRKIDISGKSTGKQHRRKVGGWDLTDAKGRAVSEGTYVIKGTIKTADGKREKVSLVFGIR